MSVRRIITRPSIDNDNSASTSEQPADIFSLARQTANRDVVSEPAIPVSSAPIPPAPASLTEAEQAVPLTKQQILAILSKTMPMEKASIVETFMQNNNITNEQVPTIYSSYFFRKDIIKNFQRDVINLVPTQKLPAFPLSTYNLYNKDDILNNTTYRPDILGSRNIEKTSGYTAESTENMKKFMNFLSKKICSGIGGSYASTAVRKAIDLVQNEMKFDILVASTKVIEDVSLPIEGRLSGVVAFIIVELGECKKYPGSYSINLICTDTKNAIPGTGSILMGAFLYTILTHPDNQNPSDPIDFPEGNGYLRVTSKRMDDGSIIENSIFGSPEPLIPVQHVAVLELARAYDNSGGLCMYEKFGFMYDQTMFTNPGVDCFKDRNNLPMKIDFNNKPGYSELDANSKKMKVAEITAGINRGFTKSKICNVRGNRQRLLGMLKTIKLYIDNTPGETLDDIISGSPEGVIVNQLKIIHEDPNVSRGTRRTAPPPQRPGTLEEFIDYIEANPSDPTPENPGDPEMERKINRLIQFLPKVKKGGTKKKYKRVKMSRKKY